jgi:hypothetical protein
MVGEVRERDTLVSAALPTTDTLVRTLIKDVLQRRLERVALGLCADVRGRHSRREMRSRREGGRDGGLIR